MKGFRRDLQLKPRNKALFIIMVLLWGPNWSIMKMGLNRAPPFAFTAHLYLVASIFLLPVAAASRPKLRGDSKTVIGIILYGLISTLWYSAVTVGLQWQTSGVGAVLAYTQPIMIFILAVAFLNEPFSVQRLLGVLLGFSGVAALSLGDAGQILSWGSLLILTGTFCGAIGAVYYKLKLQTVQPSFANLVQAFMTFLTMYAVSLFTEPGFQAWDLTYLGILAFSGAGAYGIGGTIWLLLLRDEEATQVAGSILVVPVIALFFGWLVLSEILTVGSLAGSALVLAGVYMVVRHSAKQKQERNPDQ